MKKVFISYRREDSEHQTGRLFDRLSAHFSSKNIFYDVESIDVGVDWRENIEIRLSDTDVLVAPIGDRWLAELADRDESNDVLIFELGKAFSLGVPIIPVLVGKAPMPGEDELPKAIAPLHRINALLIRPGRDFHPDTDRLIGAIENSKRSRKVPENESNPNYRSLAFAQEQIAKLMKWEWDRESDLLPRIQGILDGLIGSSAEQQIEMAKKEWPTTGHVETTDGQRWNLFSREWESGPGRDVHKRCLAMYIVGDSIESLAIYEYIGDFFGGNTGVKNPDPIVSSGEFKITEVNFVGPG